MLLSFSVALAKEYFVAKTGNNHNLGTKKQPFLTLEHAVKMLEPGDRCYIRKGIYREQIDFSTSGTKEMSIALVAWPGETVTIKGTERVKGMWTRHTNKIYKIPLDASFTQVFWNDQLLTEARWPNRTFEQLWDRDTWARADEGSRYGRMVDPNLAKTNIDWTGAIAVLNVAHQFFTWTRTVTGHEKGSDTFTYSQDFSWNGSLRHVGLYLLNPDDSLSTEPNIARHNTVFNMGNAAINYRGPGHIVELNHVYDGGLACKDVALVYTGQPQTAGNIVRYNWVHGCYTERVLSNGLRGGLGIRGDDQTRRLTVHHNVVWDCGRDGIIVKGDFNKVFNNTVFNIGTENRHGNYINLHTDPEPEKWWRDQYPLLPEQNLHSQIFNNIALTITGNNRGEPFPNSDKITNNYQAQNLPLMSLDDMDFRPRPNSVLIDGGTIIDGLPKKYNGNSPEIGAYEYGQERWIPGHRNILWLFLMEKNNGQNELQLYTILSIFKDMNVDILDDKESTLKTITLTPDNWNQKQSIILPENLTQSKLEIKDFNFKTELELDKIDIVWGKRISIPVIP